ncbi:MULTISPECIES: hypothetical protein [Psychrilyobacter]|nr:MULTISPECIES: hypothetical protein [Psychrilyobacter]MCS5420491.1 hypothetical protein [Psychrilyobacter sp. S5]
MGKCIYPSQYGGDVIPLPGADGNQKPSENELEIARFKVNM